MTFIGKFMLLLHTLGSFAILTWSMSHYMNRMNWADVTYEKNRNLDASVKHWQSQIVDVQKLYGPVLDRNAKSEADLEQRRIRIAEREAEARGGKFYNIYFNADSLPPLQDPRDDTSETQYSRSYRVVFGPLQDPNRVIKGVDKTTELKSVDALQKLLDDSNKEAAGYTEMIAKSLAEKRTISEQTVGLESKTKRLKIIVRDLDDEKDVLTDSRINWDEQLNTLTKRNKQLLNRLGQQAAPEEKK